MRVFIAGSSGQLGRDSLGVFEAAHDVQGADLPELDITDAASVHHALNSFQPDVVVNCAAYTAVDKCESETELAAQVNTQGPACLAAWTAAHQVQLIHVSTDYVFPGDRTPPAPYREDDTPGPVSAYGRTKLDGERAVEAAGGSWAILRTAWLYGANGHNFLKTMLKLALSQPKRTLRVVDDQYGSPTCSRRLAEQIRVVAEGKAQGIFHATSEGYGTWYELANRFLQQMQVPFSMEPCGTEAYPTPAVRPHNSILENGRLKELGCNCFMDWRVELDAFVEQHKTALIQEAEENAVS